MKTLKLHKNLLATAVGAILTAVSSFSAVAGTVDLSGQVNANLNTYTNGSVYPANGGFITIGGINFNLNALPSDGTGVIQTNVDPTVFFNIPVGEFGVTTIYAIANSAFGTAGFTAGQLVFNGSLGDTFTYIFTEGDNIRDHATTGFNILAPNVFATMDFGQGDRLDVQKIVLPSVFATETLTGVAFSYVGDTVPGNGEAFLAALTTTTAAAAVPEPSTWATMLLGFAGMGFIRNRRSRKNIARTD